MGVVSCPGSQYKVIILPKEELDKANKDKKHYPSNFKVKNFRICFFFVHCSWILLVYFIGLSVLSFSLSLSVPPAPLSLQVQVILSEVGSLVNQVDCEFASVADDEDLYQDEENLSDTDPEDEWESAAI